MNPSHLIARQHTSCHLYSENTKYHPLLLGHSSSRSAKDIELQPNDLSIENKENHGDLAINNSDSRQSTTENGYIFLCKSFSGTAYHESFRVKISHYCNAISESRYIIWNKFRLDRHVLI
ncbi:hypothetical protein [Chitinivorax sp. B]|uniref:hypothetical protein n=1 Tax=Chitinivorax sp. B TaxID=2502235 RepID=UPI0010F51293|nr:hypothetical protein [Chitinivorax sp. B]